MGLFSTPTNRVSTAKDLPKKIVGIRLKILTPEQVERIDEVLTPISEYGEVHLIVQKGELRYINKVKSFKAWNDKPK